MPPWYLAELRWKSKLVNRLLTNCIFLTVKSIPTFDVFQVGVGKTGLLGESCTQVEAKLFHHSLSPLFFYAQGYDVLAQLPIEVQQFGVYLDGSLALCLSITPFEVF